MPRVARSSDPHALEGGAPPSAASMRRTACTTPLDHLDALPPGGIVVTGGFADERCAESHATRRPELDHLAASW